MSRRKKVSYAEDESSEEEADFSASEDEWQPNGQESSDAESEELNDDDFDEATTAKLAYKRRASRGGSNSGRKSHGKLNKTISTLRSRMHKRYNPVGNTSTSSSARPISLDISKILESSQYQAKKSIPRSQDCEDSSESSGDEHLIKPDQLDLKSSFFDLVPKSKTTHDTEGEAPDFDCNAGLKLSDSENEEEMEEVKAETIGQENEIKCEEEGGKRTLGLIAGINQKSAGQVDFQHLIKYNQEAQEAEEKLKRIKTTAFKNDDSFNVSKILAMGEGTSISCVVKSQDADGKVKKKRKKAVAGAGSDSEGEWEQVQDETASTSIAGLTDILQINIPLPSRSSDEKRKSAVDVEMMIKRKLNRTVKEHQSYLHKVSLLCHISHGLYCNRVLNNPSLLSASLKLLPNKTCYPDGPTCIKYFESISKWYKGAIPIRKKQMYLGTSKKSKLPMSLALQIKYKESLCKKDFVLIFIILLRAMGIPCRLVINLTPLPLRPPQHELHSLSTKPKDAKKSEKKKNTSVNIDHTYEKHTTGKSKRKTRSGSSKKHADKPTPQKQHEDISDKVDKHCSNKQDKKKKAQKKDDTQDRSKTKKQAADKSDKKCSKSKDSKRLDKKDGSKSKVDMPVELNDNVQNTTEGKEQSNPQPNAADSVPNSESGPSAPKRTKKPSHDPEKKPASSLRQKLGKHSSTKTTPVSDCTGKMSDTQSLDESEPKPNKIPKRSIFDPDYQPEDEKVSVSSEQKEKQQEKTPSTESVAIGAEDNVAKNSTKCADSQQAESISKSEPAPQQKSAKVPTLSQKLKGGARGRNAALAVPEEHQAQVPVQVETKHFKEINQNAGPKRKKPTQKQAVADGTSSKKKLKKEEKIFFQVPTTRSTRSKTKQDAEKLVIPQLDGADDTRVNLKRLKTKSRKPSNSDDDFVPSPPKKIRPNATINKSATTTTKKDKRVLSSDSEDGGKMNSKKMDIWVEVYSEKEEKWVPINLFKCQVNNPDELRKSATAPVAYVFAWDNDNSMKDVSPRYCPLWNTATRKQRVDKEWLDIAIRDYLGRKTTRSKAEDLEFHRIHIEKPMPTAISEYKNHPLYALQRHLLKFEAIYPPDALTLGFVRGEPVYSRDCVHTLHSREIWLKSARVVKPGEQPYKIVKARPKWDRVTNSVITDLPLEIFGKWQTMDYDPPTAENGIVPRNAYGNVDLFKPSMLPKKTVHLDLPGLNRVCKKLKIDCAPAVVGFDFHQGMCHPIIEGYVVCEEYHDTVLDAWNREQEEAERKEDEKYYSRVYGNWKKLYRGLLLRERLKKKYNFTTLKIDDGKSKKSKKN